MQTATEEHGRTFRDAWIAGVGRHFPGEPKPVYVDWESPLLVHQLFRLARGAGGPVEFSEMLPGPGELWLDIDGAPRTSELRCAVFSGGTTP